MAKEKFFVEDGIYTIVNAEVKTLESCNFGTITYLALTLPNNKEIRIYMMCFRTSDGGVVGGSIIPSLNKVTWADAAERLTGKQVKTEMLLRGRINYNVDLL